MFRGCEQGLFSWVKQWCLRVGIVIFIKGTNELDREVVMSQEIICNKLVIEGKIEFVPATTIETLASVYKVMIALQGSQAPEWTPELEKAMTSLRVYAYNTINKVQA